jgi:hypothetical protein
MYVAARPIGAESLLCPFSMPGFSRDDRGGKLWLEYRDTSTAQQHRTQHRTAHSSAAQRWC